MVRCAAPTDAGHQCKRQAADGTPLCKQHQKLYSNTERKPGNTGDTRESGKGHHGQRTAPTRARPQCSKAAKDGAPQCIAPTEAGHQCTRPAADGTPLCKQHQKQGKTSERKPGKGGTHESGRGCHAMNHGQRTAPTLVGPQCSKAAKGHAEKLTSPAGLIYVFQSHPGALSTLRKMFGAHVIHRARVCFEHLAPQ